VNGAAALAPASMTFSPLHVGLLLLVMAVVMVTVGWFCGAKRLEKVTKERDVLYERLAQHVVEAGQRRAS
jgi:preprotein translocase subunit YajC